MLMDTQAGADSIEAAATREGTAKVVLEGGSAAPIVDPMIGRLFGAFFREARPERVAPLREVMEQTPPQGIAGALRGMAIRRDRRADLARISVPTLVLVGEEDVITPIAVAKSLAEAIEQAERADVQIYSILYSTWKQTNGHEGNVAAATDPGFIALRTF